jgi:hypothetical protein
VTWARFEMRATRVRAGGRRPGRHWQSGQERCPAGHTECNVPLLYVKDPLTCCISQGWRVAKYPPVEASTHRAFAAVARTTARNDVVDVITSTAGNRDDVVFAITRREVAIGTPAEILRLFCSPFLSRVSTNCPRIEQAPSSTSSDVAVHAVAGRVQLRSERKMTSPALLQSLCPTVRNGQAVRAKVNVVTACPTPRVAT